MKAEIYKEYNGKYIKIGTINNIKISVDSVEYVVDKRKEK